MAKLNNTRPRAPGWLALVGLLLAAGGAALVSIPAGLVVAGVLLFLDAQSERIRGG